MKKLAQELIDQMPELTALRHSSIAWENTELNQPYIKQTINDLRLFEGDESAIVISGGPSLHRQDSVRRIVNSDYKGTIICVDGSLSHCLRNGLVPDFVLTLDPNRTRVVRWFGDPDYSLEKEDKDDYFRRQEMDPYLGAKEIERNLELIELVDKYGPRIKSIIATSVSQSVTNRCIQSGMDLYWWNPVYDDFDNPESLTRKAFRLNKAPCLVTGGNVGTTAWVFGHAVLKKQIMALVGMDFSYLPGTPLGKTQYGREIAELFGEAAEEAFVEIYNPYLKENWFTDPAYYWYRASFLEMVNVTQCQTINCTEGGILFGDGLEFISLDEFLSNH